MTMKVPPEVLPEVLPMDEHNTRLISHTHPPQWQSPDPAPQYHLVVIGAGPAGLVAAAGAAGLGAKVALIEKNLMGGDCLNVGCVPSKCLIRAGRAVWSIRGGERFGIHSKKMDLDVDFGAVMERMRQVRANLSHHDSAKRFSELGIDVFLGAGHFKGPGEIEVDGKILKYRKALIATGARAFEPPIPGLKEAGFLTNETVFSLTEQPKRLLVIGGGPIGCELAQAFRRFGTEVTIVEMMEHFLMREDRSAAEILQKRLTGEGIQIFLKSTVEKVEVEDGKKKVILKTPDGEKEMFVDQILIGAGRVPNVDNLNLEAVKVDYDKRKGVLVNDRLQTSNSKIYAAGDICLPYKFTHTADFSARIVIENALFGRKSKFSSLLIPWCTYTDPEIAHVGIYGHEAEKQGIAIDTFVKPLSDVDRAVADGETEGFVKVHVKKGTDKILGATIVASHAGEMISEITLAMVGGLGLKTLGKTIHPYPTQSDALRQVADMYNRTRLTPFTKKILKFLIGWRS